MNRWRILSIGRTEVFIHPAVLLYAAYAFLTGHFTFAAIAFGSILLHEVAHASVAALLGKPPRSIELTPLGAVMRLEDDQHLSPFQQIIVLLSGPEATLLLCHAAILMAKVTALNAEVLRMLFLSNLSILAMNLIPALPLDGGRLLSVLLGLFLPLRLVHRMMRIIGSVVGLCLIALNIYASWHLGGWNLSLAFAGCCLMYSAAVSTTTHAMAELRWFMSRKIALEQQGGRRTVTIAALHTQTLRQLVRRLPSRAMAVFLCVEAGSMKLLGWITEDELIQKYLTGSELRLGDALKNAPEREKP